jgi:hypothetical protein
VSTERRFAMGWSQFAAVLVGVAAVVIVAVLAVSDPYVLNGIYYRYVWGPRLERQFGFTVEERALSRGRGVTERHLVIASVAPSGLLARSGVHSDDVPLNCHHGCAFGFYSALMSARENPGVRLRVLRSSDLAAQGSAVREVTIVSPGEPSKLDP